jgi:multiple sugar transport system substrate-binding protein
MKKTLKIKLTILILVALSITTAGFRCKFISPAEKELLKPVELTWWGVFDNPESFREIIADYTAIHPHIKINYRELRQDEFEKELIDALAEDRGPDIFTLHNTWIKKHLSKIEPLPEKTKMAYETIQKSLGLKEEKIIEIKESASITAPQLKNKFVDAVYDDVIIDGKVYGLPLYVDTLVLFYNRDLLNNAGIPLPPNNWSTLQENIKRLTYQDNEGKLIQSGVAIGTGKNVDRSSDIIALLMMQNGAQMTEGRNVIFSSIPPGFTDRTYNPGPEAVRFYTDFANPGKEVYTWNKDFPVSVDSFAQGQTAMMFGYNYHIPYLEFKRQGKLNYGIAKMPQIEGRPEINLASYWVHTVSKKSKNINEAWDFIQFMTTKEKEAEKYLNNTLRPTALRTLIEGQLENDDLEIFADQLLTAKSWYHGNDPQAMENSLIDMVESINNGATLRDAIDLATQKIQQTL